MSAADGHVVTDPDEPGPFDRCALCRVPVGWSAELGAWVTLVGANAECYGR
jgi:hypothetical protein